MYTLHVIHLSDLKVSNYCVLYFICQPLRFCVSQPAKWRKSVIFNIAVCTHSLCLILSGSKVSNYFEELV